MGRNVTVILVDPAGDPVGVLPPFDVEVPWWPETREVVDTVRERHGLEITVLRLLRTEPGPPHGGRVTYLASTDRRRTRRHIDHCQTAPDAAPVDDVPELADHPLRAPWARPGGPEQILAWAGDRMAAIGRPVLAVEQQRTWNLSAIWRLDTASGPAWLKVVPPFFAHEPAVLTWLHRAVPGRAPVPLVGEPGRVIMDRVGGDDRHGASAAERLPMVRSLVRIQAAALGALDDLRAQAIAPLRSRDAFAGAEPMVRSLTLAHAVPSLGLADLKAAAIDVIDRRGGEASRRAAGEPPADALAALDALVDGLDDRIAAIGACGVPTTLTHGDFHPGNVRVADGAGPVILDWGDSVLTHPGFDLLRIREGLDGEGADAVTSVWSAEWRAAVPGCDPERAVDLLMPLAELRNAVMYAGFLDGIEPSEWPYHALDVLPPLLTAANLASVPG